MSKFTILHNPRCSKSRQALALLEAHNIEPDIILYLEDTPTVPELKQIVKKTGLMPRELLRKNEQAYKDNNLTNNTLTDEQILELMHEFPKLIERPIVIKGNKAIVGRPPENVLGLLN